METKHGLRYSTKEFGFWVKPNINICYYATVTDRSSCSVYGELKHSVSLKTFGVNEPHQLNLIIFPNPFTHQLFVSNMHEVKTLQLFDALGKEVKIHINDNSVTTEPKLPSDMYFLKAQFKNSSFVTHKVLRE